MPTPHYISFGVCFCSDVALNLPPAPLGEKPRFTLSKMQGRWPAEGAGPVVQEDRDDWTALRVYQDGFVEVEWTKWLRFWIDPSGQNVRYRVCEEEYPTAFEAYVANFATSTCLLLQGEEMLHSTVVSYHGAGIGFLGNSGAGKSTFTAYLLGLGAELVTDDMLRITEHHGKLHAEPGPPRLKLFEETAKRYLPHLMSRGRWNPVSEKYLFDTEDATTLRQSTELDFLVLLSQPSRDDDEEVSLTKLDGLELFKTIIASTMNFRLLTVDRLGRQFEYANRLAKRLPVFSLEYPRRHEMLPEALLRLEDLIVKGA